MTKTLNLIGEKYNLLTVIKEVEPHITKGGTKQRKWECLCECGNTVKVTTQSLRSGNTKSCGCYKKEKVVEFNKTTKTKHGHAVDGKYTKTYYWYYSMLQRCYNPKNISYPNYGAKGITVCDRWRYGEDNKSGFECFLEDMGECPSGLSIDRVEVKSNYEPSNCVWSTNKEQANNRNSSRYLTYEGKTQTLVQWAEELNINAATLAGRLDKQGMSVKEAFTTPVIKRTKGITYQGRTLTIAKWAEEIGIDRKVIGWRLRNGWTVEDALTTTLDISKSRKK